ncbi:hypothetical protein AWN76_004685 [Rhodothermaceae bacterium RA]|nr:hypothetical protein AWN76_004685 [Rhodothermaceae bacterium RA]
MARRCPDFLRRSGAILLSLLAPASLLAQPSGEAPVPYAPPIVAGPVHDAPHPAFDQEHLRLALTFDPAAGRLTALATLTLTPLRPPPDTLVLAAAGLAVDSVHAGPLDRSGTPVPAVTRPGDSLLIALDTLDLSLDTPIRLEIFYSATPRQGLFVRPGSAPGTTQIWTEGGPSAARYWFPLLDHPADNITSELIVTVPPTHTVVAAGRTVATEAVPDGSRVRLLQDQPHRADQVLLAIGAFEAVQDTLRLPNGRRLPFVAYLPPGRRAAFEPTFGRIPEMLRFFSERLGMAYPWPRVAVAALRDFHPGLRDGTGLLLIDEERLRDTRALVDDPGDAELAEAIARQWAGHVLSPTYWTDLWLTDGLAAFLAAAYLEATHGRRAYLEALAGLQQAYLDETARYHRPLVWDRWTWPDQMSDAHSRGKGAWVWHMLRVQLGDDAFWSGLASFLGRHAFDTADTEDLRRAMEAAAGRPLAEVFDQWVYSAGLPVLDARYTHNARSEALTLSIEQVQTGDWVPGVFTVDLTAEVHTLLGIERHDLRLDRPARSVTLPAAMPPRFVLLDPEREVLHDLRLEQPAAAWVAQLRYAPQPRHRLEATRALQAFLDDPALFIGLRTALQSETDPAVRAAILRLIGALPSAHATEPVLLAACDDEAPIVREAVLEALGRRTASADAARCARRRAESDRSYCVQAAAVRALATMKAPDAVAIARSALVTPSAGEVIRRAALAVVDHLDLPRRERIDLLVAHTRPDHAVAVRTQAIAALAAHADDRAVLNRLIALLDDPSVRIREAAILSLAASGQERARAALEAHRAREPHRLLQDLLEARLATVSDPP